MAIPRYDELQFPILEILSDGNEKKGLELVHPLSQKFNLSENEINKMYESGNGPIFKDRIQWALSYLNLAGLVDKPKRGIYKINKEGRSQLNSESKFKTYIKKKLASRDSNKKTEKLESEPLNSELTPEESLFSSYEGIKKSIYREIIDTILSKTAREFEKLVVDLLQKMGYGGEVENSGMVTQYSNDQGIDGIIKEDILGFGRIYIQAKRYSTGNNISREEIQKFVGALAVAQSDKGAFITTSEFTKGAYQYVQNLTSSKIVLINGEKLARYIYDYEIGMQTERTIVIKKLDSDFWDNLQDDEKNTL
jgi:restriction system protein